MTPTEAKNYLSNYYNLPFREYQEEAIEFILKSEKRFVFLEAPTGSGKSLIGIVSGIAKGGVTYSVHSKILQTQIIQNFPEAYSLFGRSNYPCLLNPNLSCDECSHTKHTPCEEKSKCVYDGEKRKVVNANLRILNYDLLLSECNYVGKFSGSKFNIVDEADNLEGTLIDFSALTFTSYALGRLGLTSYIESLKKTSKNSDLLLSSWVGFAKTAAARALSIVEKLSSIIDTFSSPFSADQIKMIKERTRIKRLLIKINLFVRNVDKTWLLDFSDSKWTFRPLWLTLELAEEFIWKHAQQWVLMSASFLPLYLECKRLGIPIDETDYKCLASTFRVDRRPIYIMPVANLTAKTMDEETPKLVACIKEIVDSRPDVKGLIHTVSYRLANVIMEGVNSPRLITHNGQNRQQILDMFMESDQPLVFISPSMDRGVSLGMDLCRFIIVAKAPFLSLGDRIVSRRVYSSQIGNEWYSSSMLLTVLQMTGRAMRSADDFCESWILDAQFKRVYEKKPMSLALWWREAVSW